MAVLSLHNTLSRSKEVFKPIDPTHVRMYVCGPTVYDFAHLGNARPIVVFDTLYRYLKRHYPRVTYVRNITDIDDKIMVRAKENGESIQSLTRRTTDIFHEDIGHLNALSPDVEPRATEYIGPMIELIQSLIENGHAYEAEGHVLFNVPSMPDYGRLSRRSRDELVAGARVDVAPYKKDPADFVLWKPSAPEQEGWESPWGRGRPGWHLECSAMSKKNLGDTFDIHGGGLDLIFPHHENEIAQSTCANHGAPLANYWVHNGFLTVNNNKMSKSLKNFFTIRELLAEAPGEALRFALLSGHYRQPVDFTLEFLQQSKASLDRWYGALRRVSDAKLEEVAPDPAFEDILADDLNTPLAIAYIHDLAGKLNAAQTDADKADLKSRMLACGHALGFLYQDVEAWFKGSAQDGLSDAEIEAKITARAEAKKAKNFAEADHIRKELSDAGIILEDGPKGTTWRR
jgi:cysteinyl-tRNA synthetase